MTQHELLPTQQGILEYVLDTPTNLVKELKGFAIVAHPHPLFGGTLDNKVTQTLTRALTAEGYLSMRPNFRGVGKSTGVHDHGQGETDDLYELFLHIRKAYPELPFILAGFSFGSFVQTKLHQRLVMKQELAHALVLVGSAAGKWDMPNIANTPSHKLIIHGENDDTILLSDVLNWLRPQEIAVTVIPGADHFFHRKLILLKQLVQHFLRGIS